MWYDNQCTFISKHKLNFVNNRWPSGVTILRAPVDYDTADIVRHREPAIETKISSGLVADVLSSQYRPMLCHVGSVIYVEDGRKCGGNRWNRFAACFRSKVVSTSGFVADI